MPYGKMVLKRKRVILSGMVIVLTGVLLTTASVSSYLSADKRWKEYSSQVVEIHEMHDGLTQALGYGGFIHFFKNLVLRKDVATYGPVVEESIASARARLRALERHAGYRPESVQAIRHTIDQYEQNYLQVVAMITAGKTSEEIDQVVRVDDSQALMALRYFTTESRNRLLDEKRKLNHQFSVAFKIHLVSAIVFIGLIVGYILVVFEASKKEMQLTRKALQSARAKADFLANMSHEIRTPMNGVMGTLQLLEQDTPKGKNLLLVKKAIFSTRALIRIINDVLDFSKIDAGELQVEEVSFSVSKLVASVVSDVQSTIKGKPVKLLVESQSQHSEHWFGDPVRIKQILLNLTSNAVKFTEVGQVVIEIKEAASDKKNQLIFVVSDTGIGMSPEVLQNLFERFRQADNSTTRKYGGTGLGMAITRQLIDLMSGQLKVSSEPGKGSRFEVSLPLRRAPSALKSQIKAEGSAVPELKGYHILVVDDNEVNRIVVQSMLEKTGGTITLACNGVEAVACCEKVPPDLILMDIQMPEMDGMEACSRILSTHPNIPIIALTANVMQQDVDKYAAHGFVAHLGKPVDMALLFSLLTQHIGMKSTVEELA